MMPLSINILVWAMLQRMSLSNISLSKGKLVVYSNTFLSGVWERRPLLKIFSLKLPPIKFFIWYEKLYSYFKINTVLRYGNFYGISTEEGQEEVNRGEGGKHTGMHPCGYRRYYI